MGSSIVTPFRSELERDQMLRFIAINYRPFCSLFDEGDCEDLWISDPTHNVSYACDEYPIIGFDYKTCPIEYEYPYRVCSWMAMQRGQKQHICWMDDHIEEVPFILYNGADPIYLLKDKPVMDKNTRIITVDDTGFYPIVPAVLEEELYGDISKINHAVHQEIKRLDSLWRHAIG